MTLTVYVKVKVILKNEKNNNSKKLQLQLFIRCYCLQILDIITKTLSPSSIYPYTNNEESQL